MTNAATKSPFELGQIVATPGAVDLLDTATMYALLDRHAAGDWGDLDDEDKLANDDSVLEGSRILSAYKIEGGKVWIITEADRSSTTILLPEEY